MTKPLDEYYTLDRESLPPEFTAEGVRIRVFLTGTLRPYRDLHNKASFLTPVDLPIRRVIALTDKDDKTTYWTEDLPQKQRFDDKSHWVNLGVGVHPDSKSGVRKFLFQLALGYLSGYPIRDVLAYSLKFGLHSKSGQRILEQEERRRSAGAEVLTPHERAKRANPLYDERDR